MVSRTFQIESTATVSAESLQRLHYENIAADYDVHYNDQFSRNYMHRFAFEPMFEGIDLKERSVLEAMCGGGQTTEYLQSKGARVTGLDISPQQTRNFQSRHPRSEVLCGSILSSGIADSSFDVVSVVGGIHHMPPNVNESMREIHRILKPGGYFCFMEPHSESFAEGIRKFWYRHDPLFAKNEAAINMTELRSTFSKSFKINHEYYLGNLGYLFVLNSMVFRIPVGFKPVYSPLMMRLEEFFNRICGKRFSCFVAGQWQKL
jgi:SAM-dependent methyltransferase